MSAMDDARTEELGHLKLALAAFALHLEAFEMLTQEVVHTVGRPDMLRSPDAPRALEHRLEHRSESQG